MEPSVTHLERTPLYETHRALGAKMMPFGGFEMPVQYSGILDEHRAVREAAGLFDVSHMGEVLVRGPQAFDFVQHLVTNDAGTLYDGRAMYTAMCNADGGAVDDLLVYRLNEEAYMLVINASNIAKDVAHMRAVHEAGGYDCTVEDVSEMIGLLALQGPKAFDVVEEVTDLPVRDVKYYHFMRPEPGAFLGCEKVFLSHTGYTGEPGLEIYCEAEKVEDVWNALMEAGAAHGLKPAGLGARDTLRLESGYCLYGHELTEDTTPLEAGLGWVTKLDKGDFVGRDAIASQKEQGVPRKLVGFVMEDRGIPRQGYAITNADGEPIGEVTSGSQSPILGQGIGLGFVPNDPQYTAPGSSIGIAVRGKILPATVQKPPFHK
ncbi:MAG: glycine cleavage system aminomethyltransferase GcvT [Rhodothermales bacterium]